MFIPFWVKGAPECSRRMATTHSAYLARRACLQGLRGCFNPEPKSLDRAYTLGYRPFLKLTVKQPAAHLEGYCGAKTFWTSFTTNPPNPQAKDAKPEP